MRIADNIGGGADLADGGLLEQSARRPRTVPDDRSFGKQPQRLLPVLQPQADRRRDVFLLVQIDNPARRSRWSCATAATLPRPAPPAAITAHAMMTLVRHFRCKQREHRQHDRHRHQRRPRNDHERHVDDQAQRDRAEQQRQPNSSRAQQGDDRIGEHHRAQREFLALVDIVFDRARRMRRRGLSAESVDRTRRSTTSPSTGCRTPKRPMNTCSAPRRALEMIEQHRQHQQFCGRADRIKRAAPWRVRP